MFSSFVPNQYVPSIYKINLLELKEKGIKSIIVDLDNTLVESDRKDATPLLIEWLQHTQHLGFQVMIVSNNNETRVSEFAIPLQIPFIHKARKPLSSSFRRALIELETDPNCTVMVGDQLLTDVLGGNRIGLYTILVVPMSKTEGFFTKVNRRVERLVFRWMDKRGLLAREGNKDL
ncbi:YqeG family HAD IIIA-type phosphatase [Shimazuella alba]|uniref:YqeG family HAD IIIA-type phosphatase n=1 Tax=Shimazuella alba TaxID=2690964 RepID=A0A6I4VUN1_9BACL|nr:YqeG family HAD IIIA-type phosphatase [Shimazuella alba]MXQ53506.1 YqeG family HAD IIIA-type phosphatase [Shimazuella alba]